MSDTVDRLLRLRAGNDPVKPAVIDPTTESATTNWIPRQSTSRRAFVGAGVGKGTRVGLLMPNGVRWVQLALALTRIGAVLVPLSTLLRPRELMAQLRVASVTYLVSVEEFRGHRYLDEIGAELGMPDLGRSVIQHPDLPALRRVWTCETVTAMPTRPNGRRSSDGRSRGTQRSTRRHVHLRQQRNAEGRDPLPWQRAWRRPIQPGGAVHRRRHPAVPSDAVLLGRRLRQWVAVSACSPARPWSPSRRRNPRRPSGCSSESGSRCSADGPTKPKHLPGSRFDRRRPVRAAAGQPRRAAAPRAARPPRRHGPTCSA